MSHYPINENTYSINKVGNMDGGSDIWIINEYTTQVVTLPISSIKEVLNELNISNIDVCDVFGNMCAQHLADYPKSFNKWFKKLYKAQSLEMGIKDFMIQVIDPN